MVTRLRSYEPRDRDAVRYICVQTGYLGEPVTPLYDDAVSFADMFTSYYTDAEPSSCFVVERSGQVVAYLLGCLDTRRAARAERIALRHLLLRALPLRRGTARFCLRALGDRVLDRLRRRPPRAQPDLDAYPAHTHFSVLPEARDVPIAPALFRAFFKLATERGCAGVHGEVFVENRRAMALHEALGFTKVGAAWPAPGMRTPDGSRMHVQLWVRTLR